MFLGKSGKNKLEDSDDSIECYKKFVDTVVKNHYFTDVFTTDNLDNYMATSNEYLQGNQTKVLINLSYLDLSGELARCLNFINQNRLEQSFVVVNTLFEKLNSTNEEAEHLEFVIASCLDLISTSLVESNNNFDLIGTKTFSFIEALNIYCCTLRAQKTKNYYTFDQNPIEQLQRNKVIMEKYEDCGQSILTKLCRANLRQTNLILLLYVDKYNEAKKLMFKEPLCENLNETLFDFLICSSISRSTYNYMESLDTYDHFIPDEFKPRLILKQKIASYFSSIKQNIYSLVDQNLKKIFVELFNAQKISKRIMEHSTLMMKILNIIPKDLRNYIREGVIFNKMKIIKSLWRRACKEHNTPGNFYADPSVKNIEKYSQVFIHFPLILKVIAK